MSEMYLQEVINNQKDQITELLEEIENLKECLSDFLDEIETYNELDGIHPATILRAKKLVEGQ